jgi:hypothetical protein
LTGIDKDESVERSQVVWDIESFLAKNSRNRWDLASNGVGSFFENLMLMII